MNWLRGSFLLSMLVATICGGLYFLCIQKSQPPANDYSSYRSYAAFDDGQFVIFTYQKSRSYQRGVLIGATEVVFVEDTHFVGLYDTKSGKTKTLMKLVNKDGIRPHGRLFAGRPMGDKVLVSGSSLEPDYHLSHRRYFLFDKSDGANARLNELSDLDLSMSDRAELVHQNGGILVVRDVVQGREVSYRDPQGRQVVLGTTKLPIEWQREEGIFFCEAESTTWKKVDRASGKLSDTTRLIAQNSKRLGPGKVRLASRPVHYSDHLLCWTDRVDGGFEETVIRPHLGLR